MPEVPPSHVNVIGETNAADVTEYDSDGYAWAAETQPPDDIPNTLLVLLDSNSVLVMGSPVSPTRLLSTMVVPPTIDNEIKTKL